MDEMNKNMGPGTTNQKQSEKETNGQDDIKIWKKPQTGRKKRYVYEVVTEEPASEDGTAETDAGADKTESGQNEDFVQEEIENKENSAPIQPDMGSKQRERSAGNHNGQFGEAGNRTEKKRTDKTEKIEKKAAASRKKAEKADSGSKKRKKENLLEKDNISKQARQEFWKQQIVEGTLGQGSPLGHLIHSFRTHYKRIIAILLVVSLVFGVSWFYSRNHRYHSYDVQWQVSASENGYSEYREFNGVILHYSQDGVSCMNQNGEVMWNQAFNMDVPGVAVAGDYAVIYDIKGTSIYICNTEGCIGSAEVKKNILKADISSSGVVAVILDDKTSNYINYFRKDGSQIDLEIKTLISGDGYPMDLAISPNGEQLITSYIYADSGNMLNQVVFRNFEVGKNNADRVVGGFRQYEQTLVPEVLFFDDQNSAAITEQSVDFYSTRNAMSPELVKTQEFDERIKTVFYNDEYIGVILEEDEKKAEESQQEETRKVEAAADEGTAESESMQIVENAYTMLVFDKTGSQTFEQTIDFEYDYADFSGDGIVVYNNEECAVYNMTGVCKYQAQLDMNIKGVMRFAENSLVIYGNGALQKITLK